MSIKSKVLATATTLTLVSGGGVASALTAGPAAAGTPSCGNGCVNIFNKDFPQTSKGIGGAVIDVLRQGEKVGQPLILFRTANFDPAEDWSLAFQGQVSDFFAAGLVSSAVALHYGCAAGLFTSCQTVIDSDNDASSTPFSDGDEVVVGTFPDLEAFEVEYAPFGVDSGLCMGVAATAFNDEGVTLQPCGVSSKTVWIQDFFDTQSRDTSPTFTNIPLINGSDTNFSHPFVLSYPNGANPVDRPRAQIVVLNLTGFQAPGNGGVLPEISTVNSNQLWSDNFGVSG